MYCYFIKYCIILPLANGKQMQSFLEIVRIIKWPYLTIELFLCRSSFKGISFLAQTGTAERQGPHVWQWKNYL